MQFSRFIGIDYSGAQTPTSGLPGLRIYLAGIDKEPAEIRPPSGSRKHWTRRGVAEWLASTLAEGDPAIVGIDHGFSFPLTYFERHGLPLDWPHFLEDFWKHWPTDGDRVSVESVRRGILGRGSERTGDRRWKRITEVRAGAAKSVFLFDVQGSVAKSTHSGLPWLRMLRCAVPDKLHFWPFDGWNPRPGRSVIAEVYPSLWSRSRPRGDRTQDQHDAWCTALWLRDTDSAGLLHEYFSPPMPQEQKAAAAVEGWILGVL